MKFYQRSAQEVVEFFGRNIETGLSAVQAQSALKKFHFNKRKEVAHRSLFVLFVQQFQDPLIYLLIASAAVIFFVGDSFDAYIIIGILLLNASIGAAQENRIANIVQKLFSFRKKHSLVLRDGKKKILDDECIVPGDIIILQEGELVPADGRIIEEYSLTVNESLL